METNKIILFNETLRKNKLKIVCAESITAGLLASTIASVSGASDVLAGSVVTYNWDFKMQVLGVNPETLKAKSAESIQTTIEMCNGLMRLYPNANLYAAVTGMASQPGTDYLGFADVGEIFVAINYDGKLHQYTARLEDKGRNAIREETVEYIIDKILALFDIDSE